MLAGYRQNKNYNFGFSQGINHPCSLINPVSRNAGGVFFFWLSSTGLRTGSRMAEHPLSSTLARLGHGNGPDRKRRLSPLRSAIATAPPSGYTDKSSDMKLDEKSRYMP